MRRNIRGLAVWAITWALLPAVTMAGEGWQTDFEAARKESQRTGKLLLVHFWAEWCGPCRQMESTVFNQSRVVASLKNDVIAVKLNADDRQDLAARFGVESLPSDVILEPSGERMIESIGFRSVDEYLALIQRAKQRQGELAKARARKTESQPQAEPPQVAAADAPAARDLPGEATRPVAEQKALPQLDGYCPVTLQQTRKWIKGKAEHKIDYRGQVYYLASAEAEKTFQADPRRFTPRFLGCDPVIVWESDRAVRGQTKFGAFYDDELYLFASAENRDRFKANPDRFIRTRIVLQPDQIETVVR